MTSGANPVLQDVEAQLHRIHSAVNDGTLDRAAVADALRLIHDFVSGAAYDDVAPGAGPEGEEHEEHEAGGEAPSVKAKARRKR